MLKIGPLVVLTARSIQNGLYQSTFGFVAGNLFMTLAPISKFSKVQVFPPTWQMYASVHLYALVIQEGKTSTVP